MRHQKWVLNWRFLQELNCEHRTSGVQEKRKKIFCPPLPTRVWKGPKSAGFNRVKMRFTQEDFLITKFRGLSRITLRREFEICARQRRSRESITKETILAPCRTTVPTFQSELITFYILNLKLDLYVWSSWPPDFVSDVLFSNAPSQDL